MDICAVVVRALPDAHLGWPGPSRVNNKLAAVDIITEYMEHVKFRQISCSRMRVLPVPLHIESVTTVQEYKEIYQTALHL